MNKNRLIAWAVTACVMVLSVVVGVTITYSGKRDEVLSVFEAQILPAASRASLIRGDLHRLEERYLDTSFELMILPATMRDPDDVSEWLDRLIHCFVQSSELLVEVDMLDTRHDFFIGAMENFAEQILIIRQSEYNRMARNFNDRLNQDLGFMARPLVRELPTFD